MTRNEQIYTGTAMKQYGGSFVKSLGQSMLQADADNAERLRLAFPEYMAKYGPGSERFLAVEALAKVEASL